MSSAFVAQSQWNMSEYPKIARLLNSNVEMIFPNILTSSKIHTKLRALIDLTESSWTYEIWEFWRSKIYKLLFEIKISYGIGCKKYTDQCLQQGILIFE